MSGTRPRRGLLILAALCLIGLTLGGCDRIGGPYQRGQRLLKSGDADAAVQAFGEAIDAGTDVAKAYAWRCYANLTAGRNQAAVDDCTEALNEMPEASATEPAANGPYHRYELLNNRGVAYLNMDYLKEAKADFDAAIALKPDYAEAYANRGRWYLDSEEWEMAVEDLTHALELNPNLAEAYGNRARAYEGLADGDKALADHNKAIELSDDSQAYFNRGMLYYSMGDFDAADKDFKAVIAREDPDSYLRFLAQQQVDFLSRRPTGVPGPAAMTPSPS